MSYFEMNSQEIAFFTVFAAFLKSRRGVINSRPYLVSSLKSNFWVHLERKSLPEEDRKQEVKKSQCCLLLYSSPLL